jgi:hypothetical protein
MRAIAANLDANAIDDVTTHRRRTLVCHLISGVLAGRHLPLSRHALTSHSIIRTLRSSVMDRSAGEKHGIRSSPDQESCDKGIKGPLRIDNAINASRDAKWVTRRVTLRDICCRDVSVNSRRGLAFVKAGDTREDYREFCSFSMIVRASVRDIFLPRGGIPLLRDRR